MIKIVLPWLVIRLLWLPNDIVPRRLQLSPFLTAPASSRSIQDPRRACPCARAGAGPALARVAEHWADFRGALADERLGDVVRAVTDASHARCWVCAGHSARRRVSRAFL